MSSIEYNGPALDDPSGSVEYKKFRFRQAAIAQRNLISSHFDSSSAQPPYESTRLERTPSFSSGDSYSQAFVRHTVFKGLVLLAAIPGAEPAEPEHPSTLVLTVADFNRALGWLIEAEETMPDIFKAGSTSIDSQAMDEIFHFVTTLDTGFGVSEQRIIRFAKERVPLHSLLRVIEIMERSGQLHLRGTDKRTGVRYFSARPPTTQ